MVWTKGLKVRYSLVKPYPKDGDGFAGAFGGSFGLVSPLRCFTHVLGDCFVRTTKARILFPWSMTGESSWVVDARWGKGRRLSEQEAAFGFGDADPVLAGGLHPE